MLLSPECADLLLEAQAATGHIIDPKNNKKLTVDEACINETVDSADRDSLLEAEAAAVGYKDPYSAKPLSVFEVSADKKSQLKGNLPIAGVIIENKRKMSLTEAKEQRLLSPECADLLLEAQAATGHIIDPTTNQKLTVKEGYNKGMFDLKARDRLLIAEAAAVGYRDPNSSVPLSVFEALKKGIVDKKTALRLLQAQEAVGGYIDPRIGVFFTKDTAIKRNLLDEDTWNALNANPKCYIDPETKKNISYEVLKNKCTTDINSGLKFLPVSKSIDPSNLIFDGVRKSISGSQHGGAKGSVVPGPRLLGAQNWTHSINLY
uniref:Uncharacterized protein n=1 Tax=Periophthalmus magnuspinnatus TaxID=409849 RepID=A0A3B3ZC35_9GOBI